MDQKVTVPLENAPELAATTVQDALYDALGPPVLTGWWTSPPAATPRTTTASWCNPATDSLLIQLHENLVPISAPIAANLGLSGLGLAINGNVSLNAGFDATLGFGLTTALRLLRGQYRHGLGELRRALPSSATATLGFLQFNVSNNTPQTPQLRAT